MEQNNDLKHQDMSIKQGKLILSNDFKVLVTLYEQTIVNGNKVDFSNLYKLLDLKTDDLNESLENLISRGMLYMRYAYVRPDKRSMCYFVKEHFVPFAKGIYESLDKKEQKKVEKKTSTKRSEKQQKNEFK